jgi:broad specificity phosphatase PhoE
MLRCLALLACLLPLQAATIVLVRHAEKAGPTGDVPLNAAGQQRAALLAKMLRDLKFTTIYTTEFRRTQETAAPLAVAQSIKPTVLKAQDLEGLIGKLKAAAQTDVILVVSHSNLVPTIAARLAATIPAMDETDYSRLILINTTATPASLSTLRFGE